MSSKKLSIRSATLDDLPEIVSIYNEGVEDGTATCDLSGFTPEERIDWLESHRGRHGIWVAQNGDGVVGWTCLSPYDRKPCFHRTGTFATYVARRARGHGVGSSLRRLLLHEADNRDFHTLVNRVWAPNEASIGLARKFGFDQVGHMKDLVFKDGEYIDCVFFQRLL